MTAFWKVLCVACVRDYLCLYFLLFLFSFYHRVVRRNFEYKLQRRVRSVCMEGCEKNGTIRGCFCSAMANGLFFRLYGPVRCCSEWNRWRWSPSQQEDTHEIVFSPDPLSPDLILCIADEFLIKNFFHIRFVVNPQYLISIDFCNNWNKKQSICAFFIVKMKIMGFIALSNGIITKNTEHLYLLLLLFFIFHLPFFHSDHSRDNVDAHWCPNVWSHSPDWRAHRRMEMAHAWSSLHHHRHLQYRCYPVYRWTAMRILARNSLGTSQMDRHHVVSLLQENGEE